MRKSKEMAFQPKECGQPARVAITERFLPLLIIQYSWMIQMVGTMKRILHLQVAIRILSFLDLLLAFAYPTHSHPTTKTGAGSIILIAYPTLLLWFLNHRLYPLNRRGLQSPVPLERYSLLIFLPDSLLRIFNHRKQRGLDLDTVRHMQEDEKRQIRGCDHEEVGLVLTDSLFRQQTPGQARLGNLIRYNRTGKLSKAWVESPFHILRFHFRSSEPID